MKISRIDLADVGSPHGLVREILKIERDLPIPVPIEELALGLDIQSIQPLETDGFEGGLLTDTARSRGIVLVNEGSGLNRRRFTIGHELGHFLMASHVPDQAGRFLCSRSDLSRLTAKEHDRRSRMEVEANQFSALLLIPPPHLRRLLATQREIGIDHIFQLSAAFQVSKEAMARAYVDYHDETLAIVFVKDGIVRLAYRSRDFPWIGARNGAQVPRTSLFHKAKAHAGGISSVCPCDADTWIDPPHGRPSSSLYEQVAFQSNGFAMILLSIEKAGEDEDHDEDEDRTAAQRYRERTSRRDQ